MVEATIHSYIDPETGRATGLGPIGGDVKEPTGSSAARHAATIKERQERRAANEKERIEKDKLKGQEKELRLKQHMERKAAHEKARAYKAAERAKRSTN